MKKILVLGFLLMLMSIAFAIEYRPGYDPETGKITVNINKGWNLVPNNWSYNVENMTCAQNDLRAQYMYSPVQKKYVGQYKNSKNETIESPNNYFDIIAEEKDQLKYYHTQAFAGQWLYSKKECGFDLPIGTKEQWNQVTSEVLQNYPVKAGWNFITIMPWMQDNLLKDIFSNCEVTKMNAFNSTSQSWTQESSAKIAEYNLTNPSPVSKESVGAVISVKITNDCYLTNTTTDETAQLPELPE